MLFFTSEELKIDSNVLNVLQKANNISDSFKVSFGEKNVNKCLKGKGDDTRLL